MFLDTLWNIGFISKFTDQRLFDQEPTIYDSYRLEQILQVSYRWRHLGENSKLLLTDAGSGAPLIILHSLATRWLPPQTQLE
jgi:hypothetical protein